MTPEEKYQELTRKHRQNIIILLNSGVFDVVSGKIEINIADGLIKSVYSHIQRYGSTKVRDPKVEELT